VSQLLPARVLIVDDDPLYVGRARAALQDCVELQIVSSHDAALAATVNWAPDVVVLDSLMGDAPAFRLLDTMRERSDGGVPHVVYLAHGAGSIHRLQSDDSSFLGVIKRESGAAGLMSAVRCALAAAVSGRGFVS
jgi:DNA-binding NarL/FixJ family response regulator